MGTWIQDYIKTYDPKPFIAYMCQQLTVPGGCIDLLVQAEIAKVNITTGYTDNFLLMGG
jgi:hypothetical protein